MGTSYALVHYPKIDTEQINNFRRIYDPQFNLVGPHITIVFPIRDQIGKDRLTRHIASTLGNHTAFPIRLNGLQVSGDNRLFLLVEEGKTEAIRLHNALYTGPLTDYRLRQMPFLPHLTLGQVSVDKCDKALHEAEQLQLDYECVLDRLHLIEVNDQRTQILWSKEFFLSDRSSD